MNISRPTKNVFLDCLYFRNSWFTGKNCGYSSFVTLCFLDSFDWFCPAGVGQYHEKFLVQ